MRAYELSPIVLTDLSEIWQRIAEDSVDLANGIETEFYLFFESLAKMPRQGHTRKDLTNKPVLFFPLHSFLVIYQPDTRPIRIVAVIRGARDIKKILKSRL